MQRIFRWQDSGFDRWVADALQPGDFIHAMPGQALHTFQKARQSGVRTVLNHATGPIWQQNRLMAGEYERAGCFRPPGSLFMKKLEEQHREEYALTDFHCAASTRVRDQLLTEGVAEKKIWVVPYGADTDLFHPMRAESEIPEAPAFRIVFAGQLVLRKGIRTLLNALNRAGRSDWQLDCYGLISDETRMDRDSYQGPTPVVYHGPVPARKLAAAFRSASLLVLPSLEEGFGLVVPQALSCGLPCVVSEAVGARDLIRHRENGSLFPVQDDAALAEEIKWWSQHRVTLHCPQSWTGPVQQLIEHSAKILSAT